MGVCSGQRFVVVKSIGGLLWLMLSVFYTACCFVCPSLSPMQAGRNYGPPGTKKLVYFIDDMNMPEVDKYGTVQPHTLIRQVGAAWRL